MRTLLLAAAAALVLSVQMAPLAKAEETTVIKKETPYGDSKTVIKKHDGPFEEKKVIIHHDND
jgi:adenine/guanine phosphoribosyltransferase-like PRPP-binding protein